MPIVVDPAAPSQTFLELQTEFYARGYDYLAQDLAGQTRAKRWLNESYLELCELADWPFLEADITGTAPLTITDLRQILSVRDSTNKTQLWGDDRRTMLDRFEDLTITGTPTQFYLEASILKVYPANTSASLQVRYVAIPTALSVDADKPVIPNQYQYLIIDGAVIRAMKDSDNFNGVAVLRAEYDVGVGRMMQTYLNRNLHNPDYIVRAPDYGRFF